MKKEALITLFKEDYTFSPSAKKWFMEEGDIVKYSGQKLLLVKFIRDTPESQWMTSQELVDIIGVTGFDESTGTYQITWSSAGLPEGSLESERVTPSGFSFNIPERDGWMHRFQPFGTHLRMTEEEIFWNRTKALYDDPGTAPVELSKARQISATKGQTEMLSKQYYVALIDTTDGFDTGFAKFRVTRFGAPQSTGTVTTIGLEDPIGLFYVLRVHGDTLEGDLYHETAFIGKTKVVLL